MYHLELTPQLYKLIVGKKRERDIKIIPQDKLVAYGLTNN